MLYKKVYQSRRSLLADLRALLSPIHIHLVGNCIDTACAHNALVIYTPNAAISIGGRLKDAYDSVSLV